jgi:branched-chain amino acid transport system substrate-binding protein
MIRTRRPGRYAAGTLIVTLAAASAAACGAPGSGSGSGGGSSSGPIKIAVIDAQSGQSSSLGKWEYDGVKLAVSQANAAGGIGGRKISLSLFDDQGDPTVTTNIAHKVASGGYSAVFGAAESADSIAMAPILERAKIPAITSGQSPQLTQLHDPYEFLNTPTSLTYDSTLASYLIKTRGFKRIAMISNNDAYGQGEHDAFKADLTSAGLTPLDDEIVTPDATNFSADLTAIRQKHPQAIFIGAEEVESGLIAKQARALGIKAIFAGGAPMGTPLFVSTAGAPDVEGSIVSTAYLSNNLNAQTRAFAAAYQTAYHQAPELHGAKAYDGAQIVIRALRAAHGAGGLKLANAIRAVHYDGLVGSFRFDATGVGVRMTRIGVIRNGQLMAVH